MYVICYRATSPIYIGSNLGLKFGRERPIRVLSPRFTDSKIGTETNYYQFV